MTTLVVTAPQETVFYRREISDLFGSANEKDKAQKNLFLQAMANIKQRDIKDPKSYFRIGAIHGAPLAYNAQNVSETKGTGLGYCFHADTLFPTWHRPYVALIEQLIQEEARSIAEKYTPEATRNLYREAANELRFPYWDWASDKTLNEGAPIYLTQPSFNDVLTPQGNKPIDNPLLSYTLPENAFIKNPPSGATYRDGYYQEKFKAQKTVRDLRTKVRNMFQTLQWYDFSNHRNESPLHRGERPVKPTNVRDTPQQTISDFDGRTIQYACSIEAVHDSVHVDVGGTMQNPATAGFDPIFYLHHCNVDRLFAIWQAINPKPYAESLASARGTFNIQPDELLTEITPLKPFVIDKTGHYWNSANCRDTRKLGYTYKDLELNDPYHTMLKQYGAYTNLEAHATTNNPNLQSAFKAARVQATPIPEFVQSEQVLAPESAQTSALVKEQDPILKPEIAHRQQVLAPESVQQTSAIVNQQSPVPTPPLIGNEHLEGYREWYSVIEVQKNIRNGPFSIYVFIGNVPDDYNSWRQESSYAGKISSFSRPIDTDCVNCQKNPTLKIVGMVELTAVMMHHELSLLHEESNRDAANYLREHIKYRVYDHENGEIIDGATIPTMTARVHTAAVRYDENRIIKKSDWIHVEDLAVN